MANNDPDEVRSRRAGKIYRLLSLFSADLGLNGERLALCRELLRLHLALDRVRLVTSLTIDFVNIWQHLANFWPILGQHCANFRPEIH